MFRTSVEESMNRRERRKKANKPAFQSTHKLWFEAGKWHASDLIKTDFMCFRVGTCEGLWRSTGFSYDILGIMNSKPGNGHFTDVLEWFEYSCRRDFKHLQIMEVWNKRLLVHLISKRGFVPVKDSEHVIRYFHHGLVPFSALTHGKTSPIEEPIRVRDMIEYGKPNP